jgi:hypothetical protein
MFNAYKAALSNGANLLSNHNFIIASPDDSQPAPSATPTSYPPGYEIFSGVFANETTGILNLTYIDGRVSFSGGDFYMAVPNTGALENITEFVASVADFDGKPRTRGVSFALVGDEYRVTVGIDALEDAATNPTPLGSVKLEQGSVATGHEVKSLFDIYGHPSVTGFIDPRVFGATPNTESTVNVQNAIDFGSTNGYPVHIDFNYLIDPVRSTTGNDGSTVHVHGLITRDNSRIEFGPNGKLTSIPTSVERYCVLLLESEGFVIDNPVIEGDRDTHTGTTGEWGYGLRVDFKGGNGVVNNPKITKCWGDSFVIVSDVGGVTFNNPYGAYSRRQGMSIIRGKGIVINNYHFEHISGTNPQSGIDFEPDTSTEQLEVTLNSGRCNDNAGYDLDFFFSRQVEGSPAHNITFTGIHRMEQWIRLNSVANVKVQNVISFDQLEVGTDSIGGTIVLESANSGDCLNIKDLKMNTPPFFRLTPRSETSVTDIGRLNVERLHITDESSFQSVISVTNPSELSKFSFTKNNLVDIKKFITSPTYNMGNLVISDSNAAMPVNAGDVNSSVDVSGTTFTLQLASYLHREINLVRTANTNFEISPGDMLVGTTKVITGVESGYTTRLTVNSGATINGGTGTVEFNHPFRAELSCDSTGEVYIAKLIYGSIV